MERPSWLRLRAASGRQPWQWGVLVLILAAAAWGVIGLAHTPPGGPVVARVNGEAISEEAFFEELQRQAGRPVLEQMIVRQLLAQEIARKQVTVSDDEVAQELKKVRDQFPSQAQYEAALAQYNLTEKDLKDEVRLTLGLKALTRQGVNVSDQEVQSYFEEHKGDFGEPAQVHARHILVSTKEKADDLLSQLKKGAEFAALAKEHSLDAGTRERGGDLGFVRPGTTVEPFEKTAFALKDNEYGIAQTPYGFHVIQALEHKAARPATFEQVKDQIRETLLEQKARSPEELVQELREKARLEVLWTRYEDLSGSFGRPAGVTSPPPAAPGTTPAAPGTPPAVQPAPSNDAPQSEGSAPQPAPGEGQPPGGQ